jgi:NitT/TauT family transport system permease protein
VTSRERWLSIASPLLLLALWEALSRGGALDARFFPAPSDILVALAGMAKSGELRRDLQATLFRLAAGFLVGAIPGVLLGILMGLNRYVRAFVLPLVSALYPIPKTALLPLLMLIFGLGEASRVVVVAISVFFVMLINAMAGVRQIDPIFLDVGRNLGIGRWQLLRTIAWPGALPVIMAGVRLSIGMSLVIIVAAEMIAAQSGLGYRIWSSWQTLDVDRMYAALLVVSALGLGASAALEEAERRIVPWK